MRGVSGALLSDTFLTAEWRDLLIVNFEVDPGRLTPLLPPGTELDLFEGRCLVSLVGFRFLRTRVRGFSIPGHRDFDEMNLRFYVTRRMPDGSVRRGVTFIGEIVPRPLIAWVARGVYGEPYRALPMRHRGSDREVAYGVRLGGVWQEMAASPAGEWTLATGRPELAFITEHYWGYTRRSGARTDEYEVRHPVWRVREARDVRLTLDIATLYRTDLLASSTLSSHSAFIAEGSAVTVLQGAGL